MFRETLLHAQHHLENLTRLGTIPIDRARFYEFGAGKDLVIPLAFYCLGVESQVLVDIRHLVREELVVDTLRRLSSGDLDRSPVVALALEGLDERLATLGITYRAPCDARDTGLAEGSIDYITSTNTLEHIAEPDIRLILRESQRILSPDGLVSSSSTTRTTNLATRTSLVTLRPRGRVSR
jgi:hypothetical protein